MATDSLPNLGSSSKGESGLEGRSSDRLFCWSTDAPAPLLAIEGLRCCRRESPEARRCDRAECLLIRRIRQSTLDPLRQLGSSRHRAFLRHLYWTRFVVRAATHWARDGACQGG